MIAPTSTPATAPALDPLVALAGSTRAALQGPDRLVALTVAQTLAPALARPPASSATRRSAVLGYASVPAPKPRTPAPSKKPVSKGALAFLDDKTLSVEEKLFRFLLYVADKYEKALDKKMKEIAGNQGATKASSTTAAKPKKKKGLLDKLGGTLKKALDVVCPAVGLPLSLLGNKGVVSLVKQVSGPVLAAGATALGFPALAPALATLGPKVVDGAADLLSGLTGGTGAGSTQSTTKTTTAASGEPDVTQKDALELQRLQDKQKEMFSLVSNMLRSMHDTRMAVISNIRA